MTTGDKVVCVNGSFPGPLKRRYRELPVEGRVYVIRATYVARGIFSGPKGKSDGEVGLLLVGVNNPPDPKHLGAGELGFKAERFRPLPQLEDREAVVEERGETVEDRGERAENRGALRQVLSSLIYPLSSLIYPLYLA